jgi:hypothetical protein
MHRPLDRSLCTLAIFGHHVLLSEKKNEGQVLQSTITRRRAQIWFISFI